MVFLSSKKNRENIDEVYGYLWNSADRLKQIVALLDNKKQVSEKLINITENDLDEIIESLIKYSSALASIASVKLKELNNVKNRPLMNVAIQPKTEKTIMNLIYGANGKTILEHLSKFEEDEENENQSIAQTLFNVLENKWIVAIIKRCKQHL